MTKFSILFVSRLSTFQGRGVKSFFLENFFAKNSYEATLKKVLEFFFAQVPDKKGVLAIQNTIKR